MISSSTPRRFFNIDGILNVSCATFDEAGGGEEKREKKINRGKEISSPILQKFEKPSILIRNRNKHAKIFVQIDKFKFKFKLVAATSFITFI